jgi:rare lipoprotein A
MVYLRWAFLKGKTMEKRYLSIILASLLSCTAIASCAPHKKPNLKRAKKAATTPYYKVGTPYQVKGVWYYPEKNEQYSKVGTASWYGKDFHNKLTANGDIYNMHAMTAAHKTLPLPSIVRVTNLENNKSVTVMVNDRGPFVGNRIIDLSKRAAKVLGFLKQGTAKVKVEYLPEGTERLLVDVPGSPYYANRLKPKAKPVRGSLIKVSDYDWKNFFGPEPLDMIDEHNSTVLSEFSKEEIKSMPPASSEWENFAGPREYFNEIVQQYSEGFAPTPQARDPQYETPSRFASTSTGETEFIPQPKLRDSQEADARPAEEETSIAQAPSGQNEFIPQPRLRGTPEEARESLISSEERQNAHFIQAGSFMIAENAQKVSSDLKNIGDVDVVLASNEGINYHKVRVGPLTNQQDAQSILQKVISKGYSSAMIITE